MTDQALLEKKLAHIEACLRDLAHVNPASIATHVLHRRAAEHLLQVAIQAAIDVAAHIVADDHLGDVDTNHVLFDRIAKGGWIEHAAVGVLRQMVGFRNILVHEYLEVDLAIVRDIVENRTGELQRFVDSIRAKLAAA